MSPELQYKMATGLEGVSVITKHFSIRSRALKSPGFHFLRATATQHQQKVMGRGELTFKGCQRTFESLFTHGGGHRFTHLLGCLPALTIFTEMSPSQLILHEVL